MPWHARDGGTWRDIVDPSVRVSGVWQPVQEAWTRVSGTWQRYYNRAPVISISNQTVSDVGVNNPASAGYRLTDAGAIQTIVNGSATTIGNWISPLSGFSDYEVEVTVTGSGGTFTGPTGAGVWSNLGTTRTWELSSSASGAFFSRTLTVSIRDVATSTVQATATITLQVEAT